jgi:hypothetical protein
VSHGRRRAEAWRAVGTHLQYAYAAVAEAGRDRWTHHSFLPARLRPAAG